MYRIVGECHGQKVYYFTPNPFEEEYRRKDCFTNSITKQVKESDYSCEDFAKARIAWIEGKERIQVYINGKRFEVIPEYLRLTVKHL